MITSSKLTNQLSKLYQQTFVGVGKTHNLKIIQLDHVFVNGIEVPAASHVASGDASTWVIEMSGSLDNYPLEIFASFISHEMIHGFIQMNNLDFNISSVAGNAHYDMLNNWIGQTQSLLVDAFGIPSNDALALSLTGYDDLLNNETNPSFTQDVRNWMNFKYGLNITLAEQITDQYLNKLKGTLCH